MVGRRHQKIFNVIFLDGLHSLDTFASAVLRLEIINRHALNITKARHGNHGVIFRNQILHIDIVDIISDLTPSFVAILLGCDKHFTFDHTEE